MGKNKPNPKARGPKSSAARPGGGAAGAGFRPADLPAEEATTPAPEFGAAPLGLPISAEEYEKLQRRARHSKLPPHDSAQEDPSASSGGG